MPQLSQGPSLIAAVLKAELKAQGLTYAHLAQHLGLSESSVKRLLAKGEMSLSRLEQICTVLHMDFTDIARQLLDTQPAQHELTVAQERAVVSDPKLLLMAICCLSLWTLEQVITTYHLSEPEAVRYLVRLDRLGIIELRPLNRYRLHVSKNFRWQPHGPVMQYFRDHVVQDYFSGGFAGEGEMLTLVHGQVSPALALMFKERLQRVAQDFAQQHLADQSLPESLKQPYTLVLGMRSWWFSAFRDLLRPPVAQHA